MICFVNLLMTPNLKNKQNFNVKVSRKMNFEISDHQSFEDMEVYIDRFDRHLSFYFRLN